MDLTQLNRYLQTTNVPTFTVCVTNYARITKNGVKYNFHSQRNHNPAKRQHIDQHSPKVLQRILFCTILTGQPEK